jgi:plasmid stabilization system protein ParE
MRRLIVARAVERELSSAFAWTREHYPANTVRFAAEIEGTLTTILEAPLRWSQWRRSGYRRCLLPHFPYCFFYSVDEQTLRVVAFLHKHQNTTQRFPEDR